MSTASGHGDASAAGRGGGGSLAQGIHARPVRKMSMIMQLGKAHQQKQLTYAKQRIGENLYPAIA
eukprot:10623537-Prorocentrum_lima.AAC.1